MSLLQLLRLLLVTLFHLLLCRVVILLRDLLILFLLLLSHLLSLFFLVRVQLVLLLLVLLVKLWVAGVGSWPPLGWSEVADMAWRRWSRGIVICARCISATAWWRLVLTTRLWPILRHL